MSCRIEADIAAPTDVALSVAVAHGPVLEEESLVVTDASGSRTTAEVLDGSTRLHLVGQVSPGPLVVTYEATVTGRAAPAPVDPADRVRYLRPSRYCESDRLVGVAHDQLQGYEGLQLVRATASWVWAHVAYVAGSSRSTDGAVETLLAREGVCRDFAHLVAALLRARDVPARVVSVYAPGLSPMDFHAVAEALVDDRWVVVDATGLAPRSSLLRIATGRDAADTAFLTSTGTGVTLRSLQVMATTDGDLPTDDGVAAVELG